RKWATLAVLKRQDAKTPSFLNFPLDLDPRSTQTRRCLQSSLRVALWHKEQPEPNRKPDQSEVNTVVCEEMERSLQLGVLWTPGHLNDRDRAGRAAHVRHPQSGRDSSFASAVASVARSFL